MPQLGPCASRSFPLCPGNSPPNHLQNVEVFGNLITRLKSMLKYDDEIAV